VRRSRGAVEPHLELLLAQLAESNPKLVAVHVVGSWRRGLAEVGDLDLVLVTDSGQMTGDLLTPGVVLPSVVDWDRAGARQANGSIPLAEGADLHVDVWCCSPAQLGGHLLFATGSRQFNLVTRAVAKRKGWALNQNGLFDAGGARLDDTTEAGVLDSLGWGWVEPKDRDRTAR
jgi:DNA polymerase/3'-5' exonuclease PolX